MRTPIAPAWTLSILVLSILIAAPSTLLGQWNVDGIAINAERNEQQTSSIVADGFGGTITTFRDFRSGQ